jgi:hypothetical protein
MWGLGRRHQIFKFLENKLENRSHPMSPTQETQKHLLIDTNAIDCGCRQQTSLNSNLQTHHGFFKRLGVTFCVMQLNKNGVFSDLQFQINYYHGDFCDECVRAPLF